MGPKGLMFDYLATVYKDSGFIMIAVVCWSECTILVLKLTLVLEFWVLLATIAQALALTCVGSTANKFCWFMKALKDESTFVMKADKIIAFEQVTNCLYYSVY